MYDYYLGDPDGIAKDESRYLVSIKRLLPKWLNGIPDAEFVALHRILEDAAARAKKAGRRPVFVETGVGASTLPMVYSAAKHGGQAYTWDPNPEKASQIRSVFVETMGPRFPAEILTCWKHVPYDSTAPEIGLPVLKELSARVDYFLHDGDHVWRTMTKELEAVEPLLQDGAVVAVDDAQYDFLHSNDFIINVLRKKLGLAPVQIADNRCRPFFQEVESFLKERRDGVEDAAEGYRKTYKDDIFYAYYNADMNVRKGLDSDRFVGGQERRFSAWRVGPRKAGR
jgi:hypothetical protein